MSVSQCVLLLSSTQLSIQQYSLQKLLNKILKPTYDQILETNKKDN